MVEFKYDRDYVVGIVDILPNGNGNIDVCGFMSNGTFYPLSKREAKDVFPPKGRIFAHNLRQNYYNYDAEIVTLAVMPNEKVGMGLDDYIWDKSETIESAGDKVYDLGNGICEDGGANSRMLESKGLIGRKSDVFFMSNGKVYFLEKDSTSRLIPYCNAEDADLVYTDSRKCYIIGGLPSIQGVVDTTSDEQLIDWFVTKVLKSNWSEIQSGNARTIQAATKVALMQLKNLDMKVVMSRYERLENMIDAFCFSRDQMKTLSENPWFEKSIKATIDAYKDDYLLEMMEEQEQTINKIKEDTQKAVEIEKGRTNVLIQQIRQEYAVVESEYREKEETLKARYLEKQEQLTTLDEELELRRLMREEEEAKLKQISERKDAIIEDFKVVREVLGTTGIQQVRTVSPIETTNDFIPNIVTETDVELPFYQGFRKNLDVALSANGCPKENASSIANALVKYNMILAPNLQTVKSILDATRSYASYVCYASVVWKSFDDFWNNGLKDMVNYANAHTGQVCYLVLRNINLTYLPCYLQPVVDVQCGLTSVLPNTSLCWPSNLRIIATLCEDEVIPVSKEVLKYIGCLERKDVKTEVIVKGTIDKSKMIAGFLSPNLWTKEESHIPEVKNYYQDYLSEE